MMTSNLLSRFLPTNPAAPSIYEDLRADHASDTSDMEERAGMAIDEENLGEDFHGHELDNTQLFNDDEEIKMNSESTAFLTSRTPPQSTRRQKDTGKGIHYTRSPRIIDEDGDDDDDVPMSLLIEGGKPPRRIRPSEPFRTNAKPIPVPGPSNRETQARWESAQAQQPLHVENPGRAPETRVPTLVQPGIRTISRQDRALWMWVNAENLDIFVQDVYEYYRGAGIWCILLGRGLSVL